MITILDKYISRRFITLAIVSLIAFITIFVVVDLIENLDRFIKNDVPTAVTIKFYIYYLPYFVIIVCPIAMLLASLFCIGNMARRNEITAMKAAGISLYRILAPLFLIAILVSFGAIAFDEYIVPRATEKKEDINTVYLKRNRDRRRLRFQNVHMRDSQGRYISIRTFDAARNIGHIVSVRLFHGQTLVMRIDARRMLWEDSLWSLKEGYVRHFTATSEKATPFDEMTLENENLEPSDFTKSLKKPEEMTFGELKEFIEKVRQNGGNTDRWRVQFFQKMAIPFANFIIVLFGAPLSSPKRRGGSATGFGISLAIVFVYFGILKTGEAFGYNGFLQPFIAAWMANIIFGIGGLIVLIKSPK
jgi:lipopolysaccharide export system permease protein